MTWKELIEVVLASSPDDWHVMPLGHKGDFAPEAIAVYTRNVALSLRWGPVRHQKFSEPWMNVVADRHGWRSMYVDLSYNGCLVDRRIAVSVDSGRCVLPMPSIREGVLMVPGESVRVARLVDMLWHSADKSVFDSYFVRAGLHQVSTSLATRPM
jgi:hypothetical protein